MNATQKQKQFVSDISEQLMLDVDDNQIDKMSKIEASNFINKHIEEFLREQTIDSVLLSILNEDAGDR